MRLLVCGGRDYYEREYLFKFLDNYCEPIPVVNGVITGMARGADSLARDWAYSRGLATIECAANWQAHGKQAGWLRNRTMINLNPDVVIAFPGGRGTQMMIEIAEEFGIPVVRA